VQRHTQIGRGVISGFGFTIHELLDALSQLINHYFNDHELRPFCTLY